MFNKPKTTPKDFFLYFAIAVTLYFSAGNLISLLFEIINTAFPDALDPYYGNMYSGAFQFAIASLIIIFPVYLGLSWIVAQDVRANKEKLEIWVRRWFIHLTLFIAGAVIIGDLIALLNRFLGGEITSRFVLKVISVLVIALSIFGYYLYQLRSEGGTRQKGKLFMALSGGFVLASIIVGFLIMGSPATQRQLRFDQEKVSHLEQIQWNVLNFWQETERLPENLEELRDDLRGIYVPVDPQTKEEYEYNRLGDLSFELCAVFGLEGHRYGRMDSPKPVFDRLFVMDNESWTHGAGRECFERTIDPERIKPLPR